MSNSDNITNIPILEIQEYRKVYKHLDRLILILLVLVLPIFGMIYLYQSTGKVTWDLPELPLIVGQILSGAGIGLLLVQYLLFKKRVKTVFLTEKLLVKLKIWR